MSTRQCTPRLAAWPPWSTRRNSPRSDVAEGADNVVVAAAFVAAAGEAVRAGEDPAACNGGGGARVPTHPLPTDRQVPAVLEGHQARLVEVKDTPMAHLPMLVISIGGGAVKPSSAVRRIHAHGATSGIHHRIVNKTNKTPNRGTCLKKKKH